MKNKGIARKLSFFLLTAITLVFALVFLFNYFFARKIIIANLENSAEHLALATTNRIDAVLTAVEKVPQSLAKFLESNTFDEQSLEQLLRSIVTDNAELYGSTVAFEPHAFKKDLYYYAPYYFKKEGTIELCYLGSETYRYFFLDWYQIPKELNQPVWSEPFYDEGGGNILMATYSVPFYRTVSGERRLTGIVTADISLTWLQQIVSSIKILKSGYAFLISKNGAIVTHPMQSLIMNETIFSVAEALGDSYLRELGRNMIRGKSEVVPFKNPFSKKPCWLVYAPLASSGWSLGALFPEDELMADISRLTHTNLVLGLAGIFGLLAIIVLIAGTITRPLRMLSEAAKTIATGNLDAVIPPIKSKDEISDLAQSFEHMQASLKHYIRDLTETTAAKERIEGELEIARRIQMGILPKLFPPFPNRSEFDIFAAIEPAREVGGDLYDFFLVDDDHLCFTIGDVSGKGVPASLFMAVTRTLIKSKTTKGLSPDIVLTRVNEDLSIDNDASMFVTLFLGILNIQTGEVTYCNAGHNYPYFMRRDGAVEAFETVSGIALGLMEDFPYQSGNFVLKKGDTFFLYTDGVTEAMNPEDEQFSEERLEDTLNNMKQRSIQEITTAIIRKVRTFSQTAPQSDDITVMTLRFFGE